KPPKAAVTAASSRGPTPSPEGRRRGPRRQEAAEGGGYCSLIARADALARRPTARPAETRSRRRRRLLQPHRAGRRPRPKADGEARGDKKPPKAAVTAASSRGPTPSPAGRRR